MQSNYSPEYRRRHHLAPFFENVGVSSNPLVVCVTVSHRDLPLFSQHRLACMRLIRKKVRSFKKAKKSGMDDDRAIYLDIEQMVKHELQDAERGE